MIRADQPATPRYCTSAAPASRVSAATSAAYFRPGSSASGQNHHLAAREGYPVRLLCLLRAAARCCHDVPGESLRCCVGSLLTLDDKDWVTLTFQDFTHGIDRVRRFHAARLSVNVFPIPEYSTE